MAAFSLISGEIFSSTLFLVTFLTLLFLTGTIPAEVSREMFLSSTACLPNPERETSISAPTSIFAVKILLGEFRT
jgi:hypothetical protein